MSLSDKDFNNKPEETVEPKQPDLVAEEKAADPFGGRRVVKDGELPPYNEEEKKKFAKRKLPNHLFVKSSNKKLMNIMVDNPRGASITLTKGERVHQGEIAVVTKQFGERMIEKGLAKRWTEEEGAHDAD